MLRSAVYLSAWHSFASPRAAVWQMYLVTAAIVYACTGQAYLLSQVMEPSPAGLHAAAVPLTSTLVARQPSPAGLPRVAQHAGFARWGLEGFVVGGSSRLSGARLLARCAGLQGLG